MPKLSFVIPSWNSITWLPHAVSSCLEQTLKDIEVIIVDDASTDKTKEYLEWARQADKRIQTITNLNNMGRSYSRNVGNAHASGDFIAVLDADDISTPNRAEITLKKFKESGADYIYGQATGIDVLGHPNYILPADVIDKSSVFDETLNPRLVNRIVHSTVAYTRDFADKYKYEEGDAAKLGCDDWAQQTKALIDGAKFDFVTKRLACYRQLSSQISQERDAEAVLAFKRKYLESLKVVA